MSWIQFAKVGDKVACVWPSWDLTNSEGLSPRMRFPMLNETLTIIQISPGHEGAIYFAFAELHPDDGFNAERFRPVTPRTTDISVFERLPNPVSNPVGEIA